MTEEEFEGPWHAACELWPHWKPGETVKTIWSDKLSSFTVDAVSEAFTAHYAERGEMTKRFREPLLPAIIRKTMQISGRESVSHRNLAKERDRWMYLTPRTRWRVQRGWIVEALNRGEMDQAGRDKLNGELRMLNNQISRCGPMGESERRHQMMLDRTFWKLHPEEAPDPIPDMPTDCSECGKETGGRMCSDCFSFGSREPRKEPQVAELVDAAADTVVDEVTDDDERELDDRVD